MKKKVVNIRYVNILFRKKGMIDCEIQIFEDDISRNIINQFSKFFRCKGKKKITGIKAKQIALTKVPGATFANVLEFDSEGDKLYKGQISYRGVVYNFEIDVYTGKIINWSEENNK